MKCFERLVMAHINTTIPETLDPLQFAYCTNRSTDDAISIALLHTALSHLDKRNTYVRMLLIDNSSAFNTIVPSKLITKLRTLPLNTSLCNLILDFLTGLPQEYGFPEADPLFGPPPKTMDRIPVGDPKQRRCRRGRRSGHLFRLRRQAHRPPLPSILLANVQSLDNNVDEI
jgi:hypothetical protein